MGHNITPKPPSNEVKAARPQRQAGLAGEKTRQTGKWLVCDQPGHIGRDCPKRGQVKAFLTHVTNAETELSQDTSMWETSIFPVQAKPQVTKSQAKQQAQGFDLKTEQGGRSEDDSNSNRERSAAFQIHDRNGGPQAALRPKLDVLLVRTRCRNPANLIVCITLGIDSLCAHNIFAPGLAKILPGPQTLEAVGYGGQTTQFGPPATLELINRDGSSYPLRGSEAGAVSHLPQGCQALISWATACALRVDFNYHMDLTGQDIPVLRVRRAEEPGHPNSPDADQAQVFLAETKLKAFMERKASEAPPRATSWEDVQIYEGLTPNAQSRIRELLQRFQIWSNGGRLPPPLKGEPYSIKLKPGATPVVCGEERYTPARAAYLTKWAKAALESGLYERAGNSRYANRMHLTAKEGPPGFEREQFEGREVEDLVDLNDCTLKAVPNV